MGSGANTGVTLRVNETRPDGSGSGTWRGAPITFTGTASSLRFMTEEQASVELTMTPDGTLAGSVASRPGGGGRRNVPRAVTLTRG